MGLNNQGRDWRKRKTGYLPLAASRCLLRRASQETIDGCLYTMAPHFLALEFGGELVHCCCTPSLSFSILWWPIQRASIRGSVPKMLQSSPLPMWCFAENTTLFLLFLMLAVIHLNWLVQQRPEHTWYLSRTPRTCSCNFFLAGVNFYRFNAKNWQLTVYFAVITKTIGNFLCILL